MIHRGKYALKEMKASGKEVFIIKLIGDYNDGDYITTENEVGREQFEGIVDELINLKKNFMGRGELREYYDEHDLNIPQTDWGENCHTLVTLKITHIGMTGKHSEVVLLG